MTTAIQEQDLFDRVVDKMRDDPDSIADPDIRAAIKAAQSRMAASGSSATEERTEFTEFRDATEALKNGNFPARAIAHLEEMKGTALTKAQSLLPRVKEDCMLMFAGLNGTGKTQMATWLAWRRVLDYHRRSVRYVKAVNLFDALKESYTMAASEESVLRPYRKAGLLVIDEIQERAETRWENQRLTNLLDLRYDSMLVTILVGNLKVEMVEERIGTSIFSRMEETGGIINCDWESYRKRD